MKDTVADYLLKRLGEWGVQRIYGFPGDGINGILAASGTCRRQTEVHPGST